MPPAREGTDQECPEIRRKNRRFAGNLNRRSKRSNCLDFALHAAGRVVVQNSAVRRAGRMTVIAVRTLFAALALFCTALDAAPAPTVVVELFTSEGCSSCPPADALLQQLGAASVDGVRVIALGEHVDYWDHQGWRDRFSSASLTHRQEIYAARFNNESIYTPQLVVDGRSELVGSDAAGARRAIDRAAAASHGTVSIAAAESGGRVSIDVRVSGLPARHEPAEVVIGITEDGLSSKVTRGENHGRVLSHAAVVRQLVAIGDATDESAAAHREVTLEPEWSRPRLTIVAFVQERRSRRILASSAIPLVPRP
ncbi:MAG TPA: DUF1223 domain-containing protein [Rhodanobacteraceae bacterium]